ncbi:MAG TPA: DUF1345 domain-containing protein [Beijerinckiaceae bacterium]|nr:DUF1345 domain-containing protein [Beijerinckiaceae bacterium]
MPKEGDRAWWSPPQRWGFLTVVSSRPRLIVSTIAGVVSWFLWPAAWAATTRLVLAWDVTSFLYLVLAWAMFARSTSDDLHRRASAEDEGAVAVLAFTVVAAAASLFAIGAELAGMRGGGAEAAGARIGVAVGTVLCSWFFLHTIFALHYAHVDYDSKTHAWPLKFPGSDAPDYWDFLYFSFNLGAAAQTSDVVILSSSLRRVVLAHTIVSFLFNTTVLALAVNVGAGLL